MRGLLWIKCSTFLNLLLGAGAVAPLVVAVPNVTPTQESKKREWYKAFVSCYYLTIQFNLR
jgi:uncharacterized protein (DUF1501 family)